jgi:AraC-like DNA-binding protein/lambda repressor-like predicted transcriptional regulator
MTSPPKAPATIPTWSATIIRALDARGLDGRRLAREAGIDSDALQDSAARVPRHALTRLWRLAVEATGDASFGLTVARHTTQTTFHALGYAVLASTTLREAFERMIRYRRIIGDILDFALVDDGERCRLVIDVSAQPGAVPYEAVDAIAAVCIRQARLLRADPRFHPLSVRLQRPQPSDPEPYRQLFRCEVSFARQVNAIDFTRRDVDERLPAGNAELARQNDEIVVRYLARLEKARVSSRVQQALLEALLDGAPTKQAIARKLAMSPRNLQRHLADEGTSFKELLNDARIHLACNYIEEGRLSVTEIAFVLGFSDTSTFSRAFKRWTGRSPRQYAERARQATPGCAGED